MKFDYGRHQLLPGTQATYPLIVYDVQIETDALIVSGYHLAIRNRGDYLNGVLFNLRFSSPQPNVIRVEVTHFKGRRPQLPSFELEPPDPTFHPVTGSDATHAWLKSGGLSVAVPLKGEWDVSFQREGEAITTSKIRGLALMEQNDQVYLRERLSLAVGESVYGLGERFTPFVKNGQNVEMWNEDGGTNSEIAYKNIPFYLTSRGYGVLVNHPGQVSFEVASHHVSSVEFSVPGHSLDYFIFGGPTPKDVLTQYTALTGRPALPPDWSFGLWLTTSFTTNYDEKTIIANIERMESLGVPVQVFHFDCFWMRELHWCDFLWDRRNFPDPVGMLRRIKAKGVKICMWINPYIAEASALFAEGAAQGFLLKTPQGDVCQVDRWMPGQGFVDFTNPAACEWFAGKLRALLEMGVDTFKTDFGERIPTGVVYADGSDPVRMHNYYTYLYNRTVFETLRAYHGEGQALVFARSATAGSQKFPLHWGGDNEATFESMAETLRGGLSLGLSGFGFWSHDISGFFGTATADLYNRWIAFGLLSSHSRLHGNDSVRMPWNFSEESVLVLRFFANLKTHIKPYLLEMAQEAHTHGWPMQRAMLLEFPQDPVCRTLDAQYMLGSALLVAPVFRPDGEVQYYLPAGRWRNLLTGELVSGPIWRKEQHGYLSLPIWVRLEANQSWPCLQGFHG